jgi:hypothetical protein
LAEGPGIHVVWTKPPDPVGIENGLEKGVGNGIGRRWKAGIWIGTGNGIGNGLENGIGNGFENGIGNGLENGIGNVLQPETKDKWLIMVMDNAGVSHYIEAGYLAGDGGTNTLGITWNDSLNGVEWLPAEDSGTGIFGSPLKLIDPSSDPSNPDIYVQDFSEVKTVQVLACIDDSGNVVSAYPQDCDALGLAPPSGSCWSSIGTESMNTWWG